MRSLTFLKAHRWWFIVPIGTVIALIALAAVTLSMISPSLTPYLEGPKFRAELDKETSKGLHFKGHFGAIKRTGFATASAAEFHAEDGFKAMKRLEAHDIKAKFNPWGILLRRWQLDYIHIKRGQVEIQTYEPKPEEKPPKPWYAIFLPSWVYLHEVTCDDADVTWRMEGKPGGIFGTRVLITPYGHDFEYRAKDGTMRMDGLIPELMVKAIHTIITKKLLTLYECSLIPEDNPSGSISLTGEMGMRADKHVDARIQFQGVPIAPWLPASIASGTHGLARGEVHWKGTDQTLEASSGEGSFAVDGGELIDLPILDFLAASTARKSLKRITLSTCEVKFRWKYPRFEITSLDFSSREKVSVRGTVAVENGALSGDLEVGLASTYLDWLPKARETIFRSRDDGLIWTKVHLSGSLRDPQDDLTPRLAEALKEDPGAAAGLLLRNAGEWIEQKVKGR